MRKIATLIGLAIVVASTSLAQQRTQQSGQWSRVAQELRQLNEQAANMQVQHDVATARRLLAEDYIFIQADGNITNKAQNVAVIGDPAFVCEFLVTEDVEVRVYGDTAVVTGRAVMKATYKGQDVGGQFLYTDVWVKRRGRWQNVVSQATRSSQPK